MSEPLKNSCRFLLARLLAPTMAALSLIASGQASAQALTQSQQTAVSNLSTASGGIKSQISLGLGSAANLSIAANNGYIVDPSAWQAAAITEQQRTAYNAALSTFQSTSFYNAQQFLQDQAAASRTQMQQAISSLSSAAVDLQKAVVVNQMVSAVADAPTAKTTQSAIAAAGLNTEITSGQVSAFNSSLSMVNSYATQTAAFLSAAKNTSITSTIDLTAANYNKSIYGSSASYVYANDVLTVAFDQMSAVGFQGFLTPNQITATQFFTEPQLYGATDAR